jgi:hypothetical protein
MIIYEALILDCKVIEDLHKQLIIAKAKPEVEFGGTNIIFIGDFLQLPAVINPDYIATQSPIDMVIGSGDH